MFEINDKVVYGLNGVCTVVDINKLPFDSHRAENPDYFYLRPKGSLEDHIIYVPVEKVSNESGIMRALNSKECINDLLDKIGRVEPLKIVNEKMRREEYKAAMLSLSLENYVALIKSVKQRKINASLAKKNISETDLEFEKLALRSLVMEISVVLDVSDTEAEYLVTDKLDFE